MVVFVLVSGWVRSGRVGLVSQSPRSGPGVTWARRCGASELGRAVAAPVLATKASLPLVVVIVLPRSHGEPAVVAEMCTELLTTTKEISAELGHVPSA